MKKGTDRRFATWNLLRQGPMTVMDVAKHFHISRQASDDLLKRMEEAGEVLRLPTVSELAERHGVSRQALHQRLRRKDVETPKAAQWIATAIAPTGREKVRKPRARNGEINGGYGSGGRLALEEAWR